MVTGRGADAQPAPAPPPSGPPPTVTWSQESGPGTVSFADPSALTTTATFTTPGAYVLELTATNGRASSSSTLNVTVEPPPPAEPLKPVHTENFKLHSPLWSARVKTIITNWIPHCIDQINRTDLTIGHGGIDNFVEAGKDITKALRPDATLNAEWQGSLPGGVTVIKSQFADGSPMLAVPDYARTNREPDGALPLPRAPVASQTTGGGPSTPPPPVSVVWINEA